MGIKFEPFRALMESNPAYMDIVVRRNKTSMIEVLGSGYGFDREAIQDAWDLLETKKAPRAIPGILKICCDIFREGGKGFDMDEFARVFVEANGGAEA